MEPIGHRRDDVDQAPRMPIGYAPIAMRGRLASSTRTRSTTEERE